MPTNAVSRALGLPVAERATALLSLVEDQWFDRKSIRVTPRKFAETLVALANAEGGTVVIGLSDGDIEDVSTDSKQESALRQAAWDHTQPLVKVSFERVAVSRRDQTSAQLLVAHVRPGDGVHEILNGDCFLRQGDENHKLNFAARQELEYDRGHAKFEGTVEPGVTFDDLDAELLYSYAEAAGAAHDPRLLLRARGLESAVGQVTVGSHLLFGKSPQRIHPNAHVRVIRYLDVDRGSGRGLSVDDSSDIRIEGPIPHVIANAAEVIERLIPRRRALDADGIFSSAHIVPRDVWLEGLVNAVVHRSYSMAGDHIRVELFPDRVEISSPGGFPGLADPTRPLEIQRYARNPRIARVCAELRIGQELGEGIRRMFDEMRARGLDDPAYLPGPSTVRLVLSSRRRQNDKISVRLPPRVQSLLARLRSVGEPVSTGQAAVLAGVTRPTAKKYLDLLQEYDLVVWEGANKRDPHATWRAAD